MSARKWGSWNSVLGWFASMALIHFIPWCWKEMYIYIYTNKDIHIYIHIHDCTYIYIYILLFSHSVMSNSPYDPMDCSTPAVLHYLPEFASLSSLSPRVCSNSCPLSRWFHPTISFFVTPFFSCSQSFPAS